MARPTPFLLAALVALALPNAGCGLDVAVPPPATPPFVDARDQGDAQLVLTADLGGARRLLASAANIRANIDHVRISLRRGSTPVATYDVPKAKLDDPVVFGNLRHATTYTVLAAAYRDAAGSDLMSDATASRATITLGVSFAQPTVARFPVRLTDVTFAGMAQAPLAITDGFVGLDQTLALAKTTWTVKTLAGDLGGFTSGLVDGPGGAARFNKPRALELLPTGDLLVKDFGNDRLRIVSPLGDVYTVPGSTGLTGLTAFAPLPYDGAGPPPFIGAISNQIKRWVPKPDGSGYATPTVIAGSTSAGYVNGDATSAARLSSVTDLHPLPNGDIVFVDLLNHCVRKYAAATRLVSTIAGTGGATGAAATRSGYVDDVGTSARFDTIGGCAIAPDGTIYLADTANDRIRAIAPDRAVTTVAGSTNGYNDGVGTDAMFMRPENILRDALGNLYVSDSGMVIRRIAPDRKVTSIAGAITRRSFDGVGSKGHFNEIFAMELGPSGALYVADNTDHLIRAVK